MTIALSDSCDSTAMSQMRSTQLRPRSMVRPIQRRIKGANAEGEGCEGGMGKGGGDGGRAGGETRGRRRKEAVLEEGDEEEEKNEEDKKEELEEEAEMFELRLSITPAS